MTSLFQWKFEISKIELISKKVASVRISNEYIGAEKLGFNAEYLINREIIFVRWEKWYGVSRTSRTKCAAPASEYVVARL